MMVVEHVGHDDQALDLSQLTDDAIALAAALLEAAQAEQTADERRQAQKIAGMMWDKNGKTMTMALSDQAFRSHDPQRINDQIRHLIEKYGVPRYFAGWEQAALDIGTMIGEYIPHLVVPFVVAKLRAETSNVILPGEEKALQKYLQSRYQQGTRLNLNHLGEAILGEGEALSRFQQYLALLARPDVEYISVKISSIFSQINLLAFDQTVDQIASRLRELYRVASREQYRAPDGSLHPKFVNLDMEEYRDLHLTIAVFKQVLSEPEFQQVKAGIVLQAYLPDAHVAQIDLTEWAMARTAAGGAPIKVRIVKGANLAMEKAEAALHGWEQAPYYNKPDVDANYKRMVLYGCRPEHASAVHLGIASHNLFDIAFGMQVRAHYGVDPWVEFEMLEGMANHQARAVQSEAGGLLLYAPVVKKDDFHSAISYLVRRLDENTAEENFLHDLFGLEVGNEAWEKQKTLFRDAVERIDLAPLGPNRKQDRLHERFDFGGDRPFENVADTDFSLPANRIWAKEIVADCEAKGLAQEIPLQINGELVRPNLAGIGVDPTRPDADMAYRYALARPEQIEQALVTAVAAQDDWVNGGVAQRKSILIEVAYQLANARKDLIRVAIQDAGKAITQADVEVSEAIDFANYYARSFDFLAGQMDDVRFKPFGTVLVAPPWNFPIAISCGGILSALMAGNTVIFKPAPEVVAVGWALVQLFWAAGVSQQVLQFVPTTDDEVGRSLVTDDRVDAVILTGGYETARLFLGWKPEMRLFAETSGKNSLIISAMADHDLAIKDLVYSAFGHNGQKCSAASLAVLEAEVYDNPQFLRQLRDAAASLTVGSPLDLASMVTPLIHAPAGALQRALTTLEPGESWLLEPSMVAGNPNLWTPGIKLGVQPGSFYHQTECFGPVLGLMRANSLPEAIEIVNRSEFGLTSGFHSLDDREVDLWRDEIEVGNAYINRGTTGAIVQRQPFGGWKRSAFGTGAKAGGPNYVLSLGEWQDRDEVDQIDFRESYVQAWQNHFSLDHDPSQVHGEANLFRYRPTRAMALRFGEDAAMDALTIDRVKLAAELCGVPLVVSLPADESAEAFAARVQAGEFERVRVVGSVGQAVLTAAHEAHALLIGDPVTGNGRLELRYYLREQAVSETVHRYGNIFD